MQETYLKAFRAADRFEPGTNLRAWLFTILHNTPATGSAIARATRSTVDSDMVDRAADAPPPGGRRPARPTHPKRCCFATRSRPSCRRRSTRCRRRSAQAVWLRDVEEFSYAEIAEMLDSGRHRHVAHLARPAHVVRPVAATCGQSMPRLCQITSTRSSRRSSTASCRRRPRAASTIICARVRRATRASSPNSGPGADARPRVGAEAAGARAAARAVQRARRAHRPHAELADRAPRARRRTIARAALDRPASHLVRAHRRRSRWRRSLVLSSAGAFLYQATARSVARAGRRARRPTT